MLNRGDRQHDIAAYFAVNGGRIGEISKGHTFSTVGQAASNIPPAAPYLVLPASARKDADALQADLAKIGASAALTGKLAKIIAAMEDSRIARRGK
jgi:hypothetical protein